MSKTVPKNNKAWKTIRWTRVADRVRQIQRRIFKASKAGNRFRVHYLQKLILNSFDAKLLAVRKVTTLNKGKRTGGVDHIKIRGDGPKYSMAKNLLVNGKASPIRRIMIPKPGTPEGRPLGIPTIQDRAKQELAKLALEPEWEALFEPNSYGFRPARRAQDAIEAIFKNLHHGTPKWVLDADVRKFFDRLNHDALLEKLQTFPEMEVQIRAWLKADIMLGYANAPKGITPSTMGTPQGGIISPLLANIALHGLENHLKEFVGNIPGKPRPGANRGKAAKQKALGIVRYADDFVVIHENLEIIKLCWDEIIIWLKGVGVELNEEKTALRDARRGFNFLGFQITQVVKQGHYKVKITPAKGNQADIMGKVRKAIQCNKSASSYQLIKILRPVILGWANYFKYCECSKTFHKLTNQIFQKVRAWVFRRDTRNGRLKIKQKYFPSGQVYKFNEVEHRDNWVLNGTKKGKKGEILKNHLPHLVWVHSEKFVKVKGDKSPFDGDFGYWVLRAPKYTNCSIRVRTLLKKQKLTCTICKQKFTDFDTMEVDHIIPTSRGGKDIYANLQLLHKQCHKEKTARDFQLVS